MNKTTQRYDDEPIPVQVYDTVHLPWTARTFLCLKPGCDELPNGQGEFGSVGNPIPVNGAPGAEVYLDRLQTKDGKSLNFRRVGSVSCPILDTRVDEYEVQTADEQFKAILVLDIYNLWRSTKAPEGFILNPINLPDEVLDALKPAF